MRATLRAEVRMRGDQEQQAPMWSYISPEQRIPQDHPLRPLRTLVDVVLKELSPRFSRLYAKTGRPSVAPERLLRALLLQVLYSIRSERQLMEQLDYNLLYRWFVGLNMDDPIWDVSVFTKNRQRLLDGDVAEAFFDAVLAQARSRQLLSNEHFTVDGTLIQAWAGLKSFQRKDVPPPPPDDPGNPTVNFHGERRSNATHESTTDPDARLFRKGPAQEARLYFQGHVLMDHRHGLAVGGRVTSAGGSAERDAAVVLAAGAIGRARATVAADKAYDTRDFVATLRALGVTPHVAQNTTHRRSAIDARTTRHPGYTLSQRARKRVEEIFGWLKTVALLRQTRHGGHAPRLDVCLRLGGVQPAPHSKSHLDGGVIGRLTMSSSGHVPPGKHELRRRSLTRQTAKRLLYRPFSIAC
jgi:transposase